MFERTKTDEVEKITEVVEVKNAPEVINVTTKKKPELSEMEIAQKFLNDFTRIYKTTKEKLEGNEKAKKIMDKIYSGTARHVGTLFGHCLPKD